MCGIAGVLVDKKRCGSTDIDRILLNMNYRGPDDSVYTSHNVDIGKLYTGMVRLSIIDLDGGRQPFRDEENELYFNGEIYNYLELKEEMQREGICFDTESDGEVLFKG